jgi:hypothetical protein
MKSKNKSGHKPTGQSELSLLNEKTLHKTSQLCSSLKKTRVIAKKPKKVQTNLKKVFKFSFFLSKLKLRQTCFNKIILLFKLELVKKAEQTKKDK